MPEIQSFVNAAFAPIMTGDAMTLQAGYVPLSRHRPAIDGQPAIVALPVPEPYARRYVSGRSIEQSLPGAVGAMVEWIVNSSGWKVTERSGSAPVPVSAKHICLLFRRFVSWEADVTRPYVDALEVRGIPHVLVGGRAFHEREEVEAIRAALTAIEWPDDELSVFATLRGPFFAIGDEELLEWAHRFGRRTGERFSRGIFHPFRVPAVFDAGTPEEIAHLRPIAEALWLLQRLHRHRNYVQRSPDGTHRPDRRRGVRDAAAAAERDPRPRRLRAPHRRRAGARQRPPHRRAGASGTRWAAASPSAASSTSCGSRPRTRRRPRRRSSRKTATACG